MIFFGSDSDTSQIRSADPIRNPTLTYEDVPPKILFLPIASQICIIGAPEPYRSTRLIMPHLSQNFGADRRPLTYQDVRPKILFFSNCITDTHRRGPGIAPLDSPHQDAPMTKSWCRSVTLNLPRCATKNLVFYQLHRRYASPGPRKCTARLASSWRTYGRILEQINDP